HRRARERALPSVDRGRIFRDDVGEMQLAQRRMLERVGLMIGRNRDDDRPIHLADGELAGCNQPKSRMSVAGLKSILALVPQLQMILTVATGRRRARLEVRPT